MWKVVTAFSALFMLGPTMINSFCLDQIISSKFRNTHHKYIFQQTAEVEAGHLELTLTCAAAFVSKLKLAEILFESIPQFMTQLLMTSAKGDDGVMRLTDLQIISIAGSSVTIALGLTSIIIGDNKSSCTDEQPENGDITKTCSIFYSHQHNPTTTKVIVILLILSEMAFFGGIARFSFALKFLLYDFFHRFMLLFLCIIKKKKCAS